MPIIEITTHISGLDYIKELGTTLTRASSLLCNQVMDAVDILAKSSFEDVYQDTPFIHATSVYHDAVQFIRGKGGRRRSLDIYASIPYSDCLECGHGTFAGYWIMERTHQKIEEKVPQLIENVVSSYWKEVVRGAKLL